MINSVKFLSFWPKIGKIRTPAAIFWHFFNFYSDFLLTDALKEVADAIKGVTDAIKVIAYPFQDITDAFQAVADTKKAITDAIQDDANPFQDIADRFQEITIPFQDDADALKEITDHIKILHLTSGLLHSRFRILHFGIITLQRASAFCIRG